MLAKPIKEYILYTIRLASDCKYLSFCTGLFFKSAGFSTGANMKKRGKR